MAIADKLTPEERDRQFDKEQKAYEKQLEKHREFQIQIAEMNAAQSQAWPVLKSIAYAPCYLYAMFAVFVLALCRREIPQVFIDFLNS